MEYALIALKKRKIMDIEIIGFIAGGLSSALFVPQIIKIVKEKSAEEISLITCIIGVLSSGLWLWFGIGKDHISMIVTNSISVVQVQKSSKEANILNMSCLTLLKPIWKSHKT